MLEVVAQFNAVPGVVASFRRAGHGPLSKEALLEALSRPKESPPQPMPAITFNGLAYGDAYALRRSVGQLRLDAHAVGVDVHRHLQQPRQREHDVLLMDSLVQ